MNEVELKWYKTGYNRLYGFLRTHHPEILDEYRKYLQEVRERVEATL